MTSMTVRNPDYEAKVRASFAVQVLMEHLGATMTRVEPGLVEIEAPFRDELSQQQGFFHGGGTTAIVDSACGYAALTLMAADSEVLTIELKINLFAPVRGERLLARGRVIRSGRTITVCHGDAYAVGPARDGEPGAPALGVTSCPGVAARRQHRLSMLTAPAGCPTCLG